MRMRRRCEGASDACCSRLWEAELWRERSGLGVRAPAQASQKGRDRILDVAIIGGGLSGLTSARDLHRAGCESFVVLEARNRVGGRTYDHDLGHGVISEAGGQWIGPGQTAITNLARELMIDTFDTFYRGKIVLSGR